MTGAHRRDVPRAMVAHYPCIASAFACQSDSSNLRARASVTICQQKMLRSPWREKTGNWDGTAILDR